MASFVRQLYMERTEVPPRVLVPDAARRSRRAARRGSPRAGGSKVSIGVPERGAKRKLMEVVNQNAAEAFHRHKLRRASDFGARSRALVGARRPARPAAGAAADRVLRHLQPGRDRQGRLDGGVRGRSAEAERTTGKFEIKGVPGQDDFASMEEMLRRRFTRLIQERDEPVTSSRRRFAYPPSLVVVDGGKGQLGVCSKVLADLGLDIPHIGLAKRLEEVYFPGRPDPLLIPRGIRGAVRAAAHPRRGAPVRHHLPPAEAGEARAGVAARRGARRRARRGRRRSSSGSDRSRGCATPTAEEIARTPGIGPELAHAIHERLHGVPEPSDRVSA